MILARILRPQGRKGEVLAELLTDFPAGFAERPQVWLAPSGFAESGDAQPASSARTAEIVSHWLPVGRNAGRVVLHFAGVDSILKAEALAGQEVVVPIAERVPLKEDEVYISDLIGCEVYDGDVSLGPVRDVHFPVTPDGARRLEEPVPLLAIAARDGGEILVPFAKSYLVAMDTAAKVIRMSLPEGLAELNRNNEDDSAGA